MVVFMLVPKINSKPNLLIFITGCLSALAFPPIFLFPFWILSICILLNYIFNAQSFKSAFTIGLLWGFGHFLAGLYWVANGPATYAEEFWWAIPLALFGIPFELAFFVAFISGISWLFRQSRSFTIYFVLFWVLFEWIREWIFTGFPWNSVNYVLHFSDFLIQTSSIWGAYGQSLFVMFFSASFYDLYYNSDKRNFSLGVVWLCFIGSYGLIVLSDEVQYSKTYVRIVQPSTIQGQKWNYDSFMREFDKLIELSNLPSENKIDIVIWPESAVIVPTKYQFILDKFKEVTYDGKVLLTGGEVEEGGKNYTSIYAVNSNGEIISAAHKYHLVPFGEYMPLKKIFPHIKKLTPGVIDWDHGDKNSRIEINDLKILPLICYEGLFASEVSGRFFHDANFFVHITNDSFYGNSTGPYQHFEQSRARAVEHNRPLVRVGSNGISAFIDSKGRVVKKFDLNNVGVLDSFVPAFGDNVTIYSKSPWFVVVILVGFLYFYGYFARKR
jgi:apolipoprotein N-acyltransferase